MELNFGERLKKERNRIRMSQKDLANKIDVRNTTISNWETGFSQPDYDSLSKMSKIFNVSVDYLIGIKPDITQSINESYDARKSIPVLEFIRNSINTKEVANILQYIDIPTNLIGEGMYFAVEAKDDGMNAQKISKGDIIIIREQSRVGDGEIALVSVDDEEATLKRVYIGEDRVMILPESKFIEYRPRIINISNNSVKIWGKAIKAIVNI